jgi:PilZ domain
MWEDNNYCWVVTCKNSWFHGRKNLFFKHKIPLAETDAFASPPALNGKFKVSCDECHKEYLYKPSEVMRYDQEIPASFTAHPLFQLNAITCAGEMTGQGNEPLRGQERRRSLRFLLDVGLVVQGESVEKQGFREETSAISVSTHGALVLLSAKVALGQTLFLKNSQTLMDMEGRVARIDPSYDGFVHVGIEFAQPSQSFCPVPSSPNSWKSVAKQKHTAWRKFALIHNG